MISGIRAGKREQRIVFRNNDLEHLDSLLCASNHKRKFILTDGVYSMDGDLVPLPQMIELKQKNNAFLLVDEALAVGDIYFRQRCMRKVHELRSRGVTIIFVSHALGDVKAIGDTNRPI